MKMNNYRNGKMVKEMKIKSGKFIKIMENEYLLMKVNGKEKIINDKMVKEKPS